LADSDLHESRESMTLRTAVGPSLALSSPLGQAALL
jgi:hypothetical protein